LAKLSKYWGHRQSLYKNSESDHCQHGGRQFIVVRERWRQAKRKRQSQRAPQAAPKQHMLMAARLRLRASTAQIGYMATARPSVTMAIAARAGSHITPKSSCATRVPMSRKMRELATKHADSRNSGCQQDADGG
jgi:hypothetical protein